MGGWRWPVEPGGHRWLLGVVTEGCPGGGGGGMLGYRPCPLFSRRHSSTATVMLVVPTLWGPNAHVSIPPGAPVWSAIWSCRRVGV
jgi:hypothetical protein